MSGWKAVSSYLFYTDKIYSLPSFLPGKVWHIISFTLARPVVFFFPPIHPGKVYHIFFFTTTRCHFISFILANCRTTSFNLAKSFV